MASVFEQTVHAGHTIKIMYNGNVLGRIQGLDGERSFGTQGEYEIGSIMPVEHIPLRYEGSISVERFFMRTTDLVHAGLASVGRDVLKKGILDIVVESKYSTATSAINQQTTIVRNAREQLNKANSANNAEAQRQAQATYSQAVNRLNDLYSSDSEVRTYHGCTIVNYREVFRVNAIAGENATFTYLYATGSGITAPEASNIDNQ